MIDHLSVGTDDVTAAADFYGPALEALGYKELLRAEWGVGFGEDRIVFIAMKPYDGAPKSSGNGTHVAFRAASPDAVSRFHAAAIARGAVCAGEPGPRPALGETAYAAYVVDPFGHKLEAIAGGFAG